MANNNTGELEGGQKFQDLFRLFLTHYYIMHIITVVWAHKGMFSKHGGRGKIFPTVSWGWVGGGGGAFFPVYGGAFLSPINFRCTMYFFITWITHLAICMCVLDTCCTHFLTIIAGLDLQFSHESELPVSYVYAWGLKLVNCGARRGCYNHYTNGASYLSISKTTLLGNYI